MSDTPLFATRAQVLVRATDAALLELAKTKHALDPEIFTDNPPFFWRAQISSGALDSYYTAMQPSTLKNFADDATTGVSFLNSHNTRVLPFGRSLKGDFYPALDAAAARVEADFYTLPGLDLNGVTTDNLILGMRAGILKDVSVGFYDGQFICSCCGKDMLHDWSCWHVPGLTYEIKDPEGGTTVVRDVLCTAAVENAHLSEVSVVYDGATPNATILKARSAAEAGHLNEKQAGILENRYRIALPGKRLVVSGADLTTPKETDPVTKQSQPQPEAERQQAAQTQEQPAEQRAQEPQIQEQPVEERATPAEQRLVEDPAELIQARGQIADVRSALGATGLWQEGTSIVEGVRALAAELTRLRPLADEGRTYREDLLTETMAEGVRAHGETFSEETYRGLLANAPIDTIKRMRADLAAIAKIRFPGGRQSADEGTPPPAETPKPAAPAVPNAVYRG